MCRYEHLHEINKKQIRLDIVKSRVKRKENLYRLSKGYGKNIER